MDGPIPCPNIWAAKKGDAAPSRENACSAAGPRPAPCGEEGWPEDSARACTSPWEALNWFPAALGAVPAGDKDCIGTVELPGSDRTRGEAGTDIGTEEMVGRLLMHRLPIHRCVFYGFFEVNAIMLKRP